MRCCKGAFFFNRTAPKICWRSGRLILLWYFNNGNPVYASGQNLLDNQFEKYQEMRPLFELLQKEIADWDNAVEFITKKINVSITKKREFAAITIKKGKLRLGMDLKIFSKTVSGSILIFLY